MAFCKAIHKPPAARPELDAMNRVMARKIAASVNGIKGKRPMLLFDFIKREIAMATTSQSIDLKIHSKIPFTQRVSGKDEPDNTETECNEMQWAIVPEI
ncbi:predicted protein [Sclerotinia sclerotiorum 1980 UF-70]|nr:predicted protein [Sclerotinia sclerotiorum 1980 UF-70]EDN95468.1 predicted protein [Sclerotinia sclerotiorum 1980 UF-70]